jgi:hypothetical protein
LDLQGITDQNTSNLSATGFKETLPVILQCMKGTDKNIRLGETKMAGSLQTLGS